MQHSRDSRHNRAKAVAFDPRPLAGLLAFLVAMTLAAFAAMAKEAPASFADLADRLLPSVVNISTTQTVRNPERMPEMPQFPPGSPFEDFFKDFLDRQRQDAKPQRATSLGSGFIIDSTGFVVTNNHVIADADEVSVTLHDDSVHKAEVVGRDSKTDLALLRIDPGAKKLSAVPWGNSDEARVGDWVMAIGNPFGLGGTVTVGIISARARDINNGPYDDFLQTDASINRGNSGGPMFNMKGEVVGINSAIFSPSGGSVGIGFAIPSAMARSVIDDLKKYGKTRRGWLGVRIQTIDKELAETLGLAEVRGALVAAVTEGGPAVKAGLLPGDVVLSFDGKDVGEMRRLPRIVAETGIGRKVAVGVWRDGKKLTLEVVVGELPEDVPEPVKTGAKPKQGAPGEAIPGTGLTLAPLTAHVRERFSIDDKIKGVAVVEVAPDSKAAELGMRPGDVIVEARNQSVRTPEDVQKAVEAARKAGQKLILLRIETAQAPRFVPLPVGEARKK